MLAAFYIILLWKIWPFMVVSAYWRRIHVILLHFNFNQHFFLGVGDMVVNKTDAVTDFKEFTT